MHVLTQPLPGVELSYDRRENYCHLVRPPLKEEKESISCSGGRKSWEIFDSWRLFHREQAPTVCSLLPVFTPCMGSEPVISCNESRSSSGPVQTSFSFLLDLLVHSLRWIVERTKFVWMATSKFRAWCRRFNAEHLGPAPRWCGFMIKMSPSVATKVRGFLWDELCSSEDYDCTTYLSSRWHPRSHGKLPEVW